MGSKRFTKARTIADLIEDHCARVVDDARDVQQFGMTLVGTRKCTEAARDVLNSVHALVAVGEHVGSVVDHLLQIGIRCHLLE